MKIILAVMHFLQWNNFKDWLGSKPAIGMSASAGTSIGSLLLTINPLLQFLGLCIGLYIGYLTIQAKHEERRQRRQNEKKNG